MGDDDVYYDADGEEKVIVECGTTAGAFAMEFNKDWSPLGFERAIELFDRGFYDHSHFFRVVPGFLVQFGIRYVCNRLFHIQNTSVHIPFACIIFHLYVFT
jgi:hypothetical protein